MKKKPDSVLSAFLQQRRKHFYGGFSVLFLCIILYAAAPFLQKASHPLLLDLTCRESGNTEDFYWPINQIGITASLSDKHIIVKLTHTIPNLSSFSIQQTGENIWKKLEGSQLVLARAQTISFKVKGRNMFGRDTIPFEYTVQIRGDSITYQPHIICKPLTSLPFRFESYTAPNIALLGTRTQAPTGGTKNDLLEAAALCKWVNSFLVFGNYEKNYHWDPIEILHAAQSKNKLLCDSYAVFFIAACFSRGMQARMIHLSTADNEGHFAAEIWSDELKKWVFIDPLYNYYDAETYSSALELHSLYLKNTGSEIQTPNQSYLRFFHNVKIIMSNDFFSTPLQSIATLLSMKIWALRWIDAETPHLNKYKAACELIAFYYIPKLRPVFLGVALFVCTVFVLVLLQILLKGRKS
jgi:hypothetical protein